MPSFNSQRQSTRGISWSGIIRTLLVQILVLLALGFAVVRYLEWSSDVNQAEFASATKPSASDPNHSGAARCTTGLVFPYFDGRASVPLADIRRPRDTSIWKLEAR
jgi:hypothetical protein